MAWCLLLTMSSSTLANAASMLGQVLCIGDDGHVAVEMVRGSDCDHPANSHPAPEPAYLQQSHCGGCTDLSLSSAEAVSNPQVAKALERALADEPADLPVSIVSVLTVPAPYSLPALHSFECPNRTLLERRTVVLLI